MKMLPFYSEKLGLKTTEEVFSFLIDNLKPSNIVWSYFVNWSKVFNNVSDIEIELNTLNYLVGKSNFDEEFTKLLKKNPEVLKAIPALVVRTGNSPRRFTILVDFKRRKLVYREFDFDSKKVYGNDARAYLTFVKETGLADLISSKRIKSLVDYMIGVEAGLDSNGRKNRGGHVMEDIVEAFIANLCKENGYSYLKEADSDKIRKSFGYDVPVDKSSRRYDFVVKTARELIIFETNFYGGGGSKLKSTAGEYRNLYDVLNGQFKFIWITDGPGWKTTARPLEETFEHNDYVFTLKMLEEGILKSLCA